MKRSQDLRTLMAAGMLLIAGGCAAPSRTSGVPSIAPVGATSAGNAKLVCLLPGQEAGQAQMVWNGDHYLATWYGRTTVGAPFFQKTALFQSNGTMVADSMRDVSPGLMGRLVPGGGGIGLAFMNDLPQGRTASFMPLDGKGRPAGPASVFAEKGRPHGDNVSVAWNPLTEAWGAVWMYTLPTGRPGYVDHHLAFTTFRQPGRSAPTQLDDDGMVIGPGSGPALAVRGRCFAAVWAGYPAGLATLGEVCGEQVRTVRVSEPGRAGPYLSPTLGVSLASDGADGYLVTWIAAPTDPAESGGNLFLARVSTSGATLVVSSRREIPLPSYANQAWPLFDGPTFWVAWTETGAGAKTGDMRDALWLARLARDGTMLQAPSMIADGFPSPSWVSLAMGPRGLAAVVSRGNDFACGASFLEIPLAR